MKKTDSVFMQFEKGAELEICLTRAYVHLTLWDDEIVHGDPDKTDEENKLLKLFGSKVILLTPEEVDKLIDNLKTAKETLLGE